MKTVLITFAEKPSKDYPLAVVVIDPENRFWSDNRSQEFLVRSMRDARLYANGLCCGAHLAAHEDRTWPVNPTVDERLIEQTLS